MSVTVSSKYQVVIPKAVRKQLNIRPGQKLEVQAAKNGSVILKKDASSSYNVDAHLDKYAGILKNQPAEWRKAGLDPADWLRKQRDEEWG